MYYLIKVYDPRYEIERWRYSTSKHILSVSNHLTILSVEIVVEVPEYLLEELLTYNWIWINN